MINPFTKFAHPYKYCVKVDVNKIVAAPKLHKKGVEKYKEIILSGKAVRPIILLKHPHQDLYAVLDGHHRFYAYLELGITTVDAVIVRSSKVLFGLTKKGYLQPTPRMTKYIHIPLLVFSRYVNKFIRQPVKLVKSTKSAVTKLKEKRKARLARLKMNINGQVANAAT